MSNILLENHIILIKNMISSMKYLIYYVLESGENRQNGSGGISQK